MLMAPFPEVDLAAVMVDGGEVFEAQLRDTVATEPAWVLTDPGEATTDAGTDQWINVEVATRVPTRPPVVEAELVEVLRAEGFGPSTRTSTVLRELARRYPAASGRGFR
jgi:reverse gyrase